MHLKEEVSHEVIPSHFYYMDAAEFVIQLEKWLVIFVVCKLTVINLYSGQTDESLADNEILVSSYHYLK